MNSPNEKTIFLYLRRTKTYQILINGFSKTSRWFITILNRVGIVANLLLLSKIASIISLNKLTLTLIPRLSSKITSIISNSATIQYTIRIIYKVTSDISQSPVVTLAIKIQGKITSTLSILGPNMILDMIVATVKLLSGYDPTALSAMDSVDLGSLDYTVV